MQHSVTEEYYSGQGVVLVAARDANGKPKGYRPIGNVPNLAIRNETSVLEHKESTTGARGTDKRLTTEVKVTMAITIENFNSKNLADSLRGAVVTYPSAAVVDEAINAYAGAISAVGKIKLSAVTLKMGATNTLTPYNEASPATPWDYQLNADAGSFKFNDGSSVATDKLGVVPTGVAAGGTTVYTVPAGHQFAVGDTVKGAGFTGADAANVEAEQVVTAVTATTVTTDLDSTADTITAAAGSRLINLTGAMPATASYTHATQQSVGAFTEGAKELYMRFEGLNTAEEESPVVVDVFKFLVDPAQELALISETLQSFVMEGSVLADTTQATEDKYYTVRKIDK